MTVRSTGENAYFAASNSVSGFFSYYAEIFDAARIGRVYAIKGGPGTGKSRFLRDVAEYAESMGWDCEYIYCSSDPNSLDAVVLTALGREGIALLDATAPHVYELTTPGAREELVDLGAFWNSDLLASYTEEIKRLNEEKKSAYQRAYRYLSGFGEMSRNRDVLVAPYVKTNKIRAFAEKLMQGIPMGKGFSPRPALMHSVGMRGEVGFDTYFAQARKLYLIEDCRGASKYLMDALGDLARDRALSVRISHDPVEPEKLDGLFLCESGTAFVVADPKCCHYPRKKLSMRRFVDTAAMKSVREELRYTERMRRALRMGAVDAMERVSKLHFCLEEIYMSAMDFEKKEAFTKAFAQKLFG